jgi:hypothetical protein
VSLLVRWLVFRLASYTIRPLVSELIWEGESILVTRDTKLPNDLGL